LKAAQPRSVGPEKPGRVILTLGESFRKEEESTVSEDQSVEEMAHEVLMRQAKVRAARTGEAIEEAMEAVLNTEAGAQLRELRDVPHDEESVEEWQVGMARERAEERAEDLGDHLEEHPEHPTHG
jgi:predicted component of type VI protein secretion system